MFAELLTLPYLPFTTAFVVMVGIGLIEAVGLGIGQVESAAHLDTDANGSLLAWLGLSNELPILIWLTSLLACFTLAGVAIQQVSTAVVGAPLNWLLATFGALVLGVALNTAAANTLARLLPGFETTARPADDLLQYRATITEGTARRGSPARAKVIDHFGQAHFILVEPFDDRDVIPSGASALLARRDGALFFALPERSTYFDAD